MRRDLAERPEEYQAYRAEIEGERLTRSTRTAALVVILLSSAFIALDAIAFPEDFSYYLGVRLSLNAILAFIYFRLARSHPVPSAMLGCLAIGFGLIAVIQKAGGLLGEYYPGLVLLFVGMPVFMPYSAKQATLLVSVLLGTLAGLPFLGPAIDWRTYLVHLFFPAAAAVECVASSAMLDGFRFREFLRRREIEEARDQLAALDKEKSRFTANVHHELRTPLTLMLAPIEAMIGGEFGAVSSLQHGYLKTMHANGLRLLKLINNLLDLAKIEGDKLKIRRRPTLIGRLVQDLIASATPLAERKEIALRGEGLDELPEICVDPDAVEKIVVNLLGNALKFTDQSGEIVASGYPVEEGGVELVLADSGIGLSEGQLERIFDRFAQVDSSSTRKHEGTGIGLALVRELVELHGGKIWAESRGLGRGTEIHVVLPGGEPDEDGAEEVIRTDDGESVELARSISAMKEELQAGNRGELRVSEMQRHLERNDLEPSSAGAAIPQLRAAADAPEVLICEDNADMRRLLTFLIGQEFRVRVAKNGREGLEMVKQREPELVLTDVMMPEMSGTELCEALKQDPDTSGIPVVLVTSKADREMKIEGLERGADDYVTKPFHPRELMARVRSLVKLRKLQAELAIRNSLLESTNAELDAALGELHEAGVHLAQAERLAAVGELAAGVAHEVNNPVNFAANALVTLRGYVEDVCSIVEGIGEIDWRDMARIAAQVEDLERLKKRVGFDDLTASLSELVEITTDGLDRTQRLVGELRDFAAPGDGRSASVDIGRGVETTVQLVRHALESAGVNLQVEIAEDLPTVEGDVSALNQVFLNLLKNAGESFQGRGGNVSVVAERVGMAIRVSVRDDGPGIGSELLSKVFEPFFSTKEAGRGTGLGLSISRRIIENHGGSIEVESTLGVGTSFAVEIPVGGSEGAA